MGTSCKTCGGRAYRNGLTLKGVQRYRCRNCGATFQKRYIQPSRTHRFADRVVGLLCNGVSACGTAQLLGCSVPTVLRTITRTARATPRPPLHTPHLSYEIDEMRVVCKRKQIPYYLTYALCRETRQVVSYVVGRRNKRNLRMVVSRVLQAHPRAIYTDKYSVYPTLIPKHLHNTQRRCTNYIERHHLTLRQKIRRFGRRTVGFSRTIQAAGDMVRVFVWHASVGELLGPKWQPRVL
jgi:insertion element IS1 protein InsB